MKKCRIGILVVILMLCISTVCYAGARELTYMSIEELATLAATPASGDFFLLYDLSTGKVVKILPSNAISGAISVTTITLPTDQNATFGSSTIQEDSVKDDFVVNNDIDIEQANPHLNFRDSDTDDAYMWHLEANASGDPWTNFTLWKGTDDGTGFTIASVAPLILINSTDSIIFPLGRVQLGQGADVASANNLTLGSDGNTFEITGTTQVNLIDNTDWVNGSVIHLLFTGSVTVKHGQSTSGVNTTIQLTGAGDFSASAGDTLTLLLSEIGDVQAWRELSNAAI